MRLIFKTYRNTIPKSIKLIVSKIMIQNVNILFANGNEAAKILADDYSSKAFHNFVYPAIVVLTDISNEFEDPRYESQFDLKIRILAKTDQNYTTEQKIENVFETVLYPIMDDFNNKLLKSPTIITPNVLKTKYKERFNVQITSEFCDMIELDINDLKLVK